MATLILGTVGRIIAGPIGGIVGTLVGGSIDRAIVGGGRAREQGRISNPAIQSATYGEPIPLIVGRMRTAGNLIWTSGIIEATASVGGGKRSGPSTTNYSYSASFAVGLAARPIADVGRIWADGKLVRDASGAFVTPMTMRLHRGDPDQVVDPLIAAAEGVRSTPAYRGLAYAVFESLPLAEFGNRIPNLTFEIIADTDAVSMDSVIFGLAEAATPERFEMSGHFPALSGYIAGRAGSLADALAPLLAVSDASIVGGDTIRIEGRGGVAVAIGFDAMDARAPTDTRTSDRRRRTVTASQPSCLELAFYDTSRDYQPGLQRARRSAGLKVEHQSIAAAMTPVQAKTLAAQMLSNGQMSRTQRRIRLSWRHAGILPGTLVALPDDTAAWRVREARFENFIVHLDLERKVASPEMSPLLADRLADGGRAMMSDAPSAGPTTLHILELPPLPGELPASPRLWIAGNGAGEGWRRAAVMVSMDDGESYAGVGSLDGGTLIGSALTVLPDNEASTWDQASTLDVELLSERDWLEPQSKAAVLAGANLALVGDELIQFRGADAIGPRQFRLHGLLRGRRGSEAATAGHQAGERFVVIDPSRMLALDLPIEMVGRHVVARAAGAGDATTDAISLRVNGAGLRPLSPAHLRARNVDGDLLVEWVRRSRAGFGWPDFVDAPLAEAEERYRVEVRVDGNLVRELQVTEPRYRYELNDRRADGGGIVTISVEQWSAVVGPGSTTTITIIV